MTKRTLSWLVCACLMSPLAGCSMMEQAKDDAGKAANDVKNGVETAKDTVRSEADQKSKEASRTIQDMMNSFEQAGVEMMNMTPIEDMEFAAHEGRMFEVNGEKFYLYRMNMEDAQMSKLMKNASTTKKVTVNRTGKDEELNALVNGEYLLIYSSNASIAPLDQVFISYQ